MHGGILRLPSATNFTNDLSDLYAYSAAPVVSTDYNGALSFVNGEMQHDTNARRRRVRQPLLPDYNVQSGHDAFDISDLIPCIAHRYFETGCDAPTNVLLSQAGEFSSHAAGQNLPFSPPPPPPPCLSFSAAADEVDHVRFAGGLARRAREFQPDHHLAAGRNTAARETEMEISTPSMGSGCITPQAEVLEKEVSEPDLKRKFREAGLESDWSRLFASNASQCRSANDADSITHSTAQRKNALILHDDAEAEHATVKMGGNASGSLLVIAADKPNAKPPKSEGEISSECIAPSELNVKPASSSQLKPGLQDFIHQILSEAERKSLPPANSAPLRPVKTVLRDKKASGRDERSHSNTKVFYTLDDILRVSDIGSDECFKKLIIIRGPERSYKTAVAQRIEEDFKRRVNTRPPKHLAEFSSRIVSAQDTDERFYTPEGGFCSDEERALLDCDSESRARKSFMQDEEARCKTGDRAAFAVTCFMKHYNVRRINYLLILEGMFEYVDELQKLMLELLQPHKDVEAFVLDLGAELDYRSIRGKRNENQSCSWCPESLKKWVFLRHVSLDRSWLEQVVKGCDIVDKEKLRKQKQYARVKNPSSEPPNGSFMPHHDFGYYDIAKPVDNIPFPPFETRHPVSAARPLMAATGDNITYDDIRNTQHSITVHRSLSPRIVADSIHHMDSMRTPILQTAPPPLLPLLPFPEPEIQSRTFVDADGEQQLFGKPREFVSPRRQTSPATVSMAAGAQRQQLLIEMLASHRKQSIDETRKSTIDVFSSPVKSSRDISDYGFRRGSQNDISREDVSTRRDSPSSPRRRSDSYSKRAAESYASFSGSRHAAERRPRDQRDSTSPGTTPIMQYEDDFDDDFSRVPLNTVNIAESTKPRAVSPVGRPRQDSHGRNISKEPPLQARNFDANRRGPPRVTELESRAFGRSNDDRSQQPLLGPPSFEKVQNGSRYSTNGAKEPPLHVLNDEQQFELHPSPLHAVVKLENSVNANFGISMPVLAEIPAVKKVKTVPDETSSDAPQQSLADMVKSFCESPQRKSVLLTPIKRKIPTKNYAVHVAKKFKDNSEKLAHEQQTSSAVSAAISTTDKLKQAPKLTKQVTFPGLSPLKATAAETASNNSTTLPAKVVADAPATISKSAPAADFKTSLYKLLSSVHDDGLLSVQSLERMKKKAEMLAVEATAAVASPEAEADHSEYALEKSSKKMTRKRDKLKKWQDEEDSNNKFSPSAAIAAATGGAAIDAKLNDRDSAAEEAQKKRKEVIDLKCIATAGDDDDDDADIIIKRRKTASPKLLPNSDSTIKSSESLKKAVRKRTSSSSSSSSSSSTMSSPVMSPPSMFRQPSKQLNSMPPPRSAAKFHTLPPSLAVTLPSSLSKLTDSADNGAGEQMVSRISDKLQLPIFDASDAASGKLNSNDDLLSMCLPHFDLADFGAESVRYFRCAVKDNRNSPPERIALSRGGLRRQYWRSLTSNKIVDIDEPTQGSVSVTELVHRGENDNAPGMSNRPKYCSDE